MRLKENQAAKTLWRKRWEKWEKHIKHGPGSLVDKKFPGKKTRDLTREENIILMREYYLHSKPAHARSAKKMRNKLWNLYLHRYGKICACCGEEDKRFLTIEHINGGGNKHRKAFPGGVDRIIRQLRDLKWPEGYATLCMNCNFGKWRNGGTCPHVSDIVDKETNATPTIG